METIRKWIFQFQSQYHKREHSYFQFLTLEMVYACSAVHSALLVGLESAKMIGRALIVHISFMISSENAPVTVDAPKYEYSNVRIL